MAIRRGKRRQSWTYLLLSLEAVNDGSKLAHDFESPLVILSLSSDELGKVPQRLRGVKDL